MHKQLRDQKSASALVIAVQTGRTSSFDKGNMVSESEPMLTYRREGA